MYFVQDIYKKTLEVKQSKFIAYLLPYNQFHVILERLKLEHPKARHFVVAYRYLNEHNQIVEHSSDDGEPKGTSGKPTLMVLQGSDVINSAIITIRYFGGTKLGTGGLVRAYSDATNDVINIAILNEYIAKEELVIEFQYDKLRKIEYTLALFNIEVIDKSFGDSVCFSLLVSKEEKVKILNDLDRSIKII